MLMFVIANPPSSSLISFAAKALSKEAGKADLENLAVQRKSAQAEMRRVIAENRSIQTLMIKIAQSIKLLYDFLNLGETSSSEYGVSDDALARKKPQSVKSMLSPTVMVSSMQEIETKVVGILHKIKKEEFPYSTAYHKDIESNLNAIANLKMNNIRIGMLVHNSYGGAFRITFCVVQAYILSVHNCVTCDLDFAIVRDRDAAVRERDKAIEEQLREENEMRKYRARMMGNDADLNEMRNRVKMAKLRARALRSNKSLADLEAEADPTSEVDFSEELVDRSTMKESVESLTIKRKRQARRNAAPAEQPPNSARKGGRRSRKGGKAKNNNA